MADVDPLVDEVARAICDAGGLWNSKNTWNGAEKRDPTCKRLVQRFHREAKAAIAVIETRRGS